MYYPDNRPVSRPRVSQVDVGRMSERLTAGLFAIQERESNHEALEAQSTAILPTLTPEDIDLPLCI